MPPTRPKSFARRKRPSDVEPDRTKPTKYKPCGKAPPTPKEAAAVGRRRALVAEAQKELMRWFTQDKLKATIAGTFDLADWVQAFRLIEERTVVGKAVLVP